MFEEVFSPHQPKPCLLSNLPKFSYPCTSGFRGYGNHRNLCTHDSRVQAIAMRLPQSSPIPLSLRFAFITIFLAIAFMLPLGAQTATKQLSCSPVSLRFGTVLVGQAEVQLVTLTNPGKTSATLSAIGINSSEFKVSGVHLPLTLGAGQSVNVNVAFAPTETGRTDGTVWFTSNSSNPSLPVYTAGTGVQREALTAKPSSLSFGQVAVGSKASLSVVLANARSRKETLQAFQTTGSGFSVSGPAMPVVLSAGQSVTLKVYFAPRAVGTTGGNVFIPGLGLNIPLTGTGTTGSTGTTGTTTGQLTINPTALNFGGVDVGNATTQPSSISASGGSVTVSSAQSSNSQFSITGASFPVTIAAGKSVAFDVVFSPNKSGASSGALTFASNASNSQSSESLTGTGIVPTHNVHLSWSPSTSSVVGYNVYRGAAVGAYSKINSTPDSATTYTDNTVVSGATYYYAATAVNSSGEESAYSTPVKAVIP